MHPAPTRHVRALAGALFLIWSLAPRLRRPCGGADRAAAWIGRTARCRAGRRSGDHESLGAAGGWLDPVILWRVHHQAGSRERPAHGCGDARVEQQRTFGDDEVQLQRSVDQGAIHEHRRHHPRRHASGEGWRVDFTVVGTSAGAEGCVVTGYAIDGGPAGSDALSVTVRTATGKVIFTGAGAVSEGDVVIVR